MQICSHSQLSDSLLANFPSRYWSQLLVNAEYAQKAALKKHFIWSNLAVDVILGIVLDHLFSTVTIAHYVTDNVLRAGCVWLMEFLQYFPRTYHSWACNFWDCFGLTIPLLMHRYDQPCNCACRTLHLFISFLYSQQIQVLASLWRLFRGRKWNPLRQRLDSYDYTVEQHVVGSLLFTPILLLLPTTSAFYIFFTMLNSMITSICIMVEIMISFLHATPYAEVIFWLTMRRRFPSGIWFETTQASSKHSSADYGLLEEGSLASESAERNLGLSSMKDQRVRFHFFVIEGGVGRASGGCKDCSVLEEQEAVSGVVNTTAIDEGGRG
ncbi:Phosphatidylinositol N-acetylglucosaminyltransferase subunit Q, partial [Ananas comosus]